MIQARNLKFKTANADKAKLSEKKTGKYDGIV